MQKRQGSIVQSLSAAESFLGDNTTALGAVAASAALAKFSVAMAAVHLHATDQRGSNLKAQAGTKVTIALRKDLIRTHMTPIARVGRVELPHTQELLPLQAPKPNVSNQVLVAAARGMSQAAVPHADIFIAAGLPDDFIARFDTATDVFVQAINTRSSDQGKQSGATGGLSNALRVARQRLAIVDALVQTALEGDEALLVNWNRVKRVTKTPTRTTNATTATPAPSPTTPTTPVTPTHTTTPVVSTSTTPVTAPLAAAA